MITSHVIYVHVINTMSFELVRNCVWSCSFGNSRICYLSQLSLGSHPFGHCFVVKFNDVTLMLDCTLDMTSLSYFLPIPFVPRSLHVCTPVYMGLTMTSYFSKRLEALKCLDNHCIAKQVTQQVSTFLGPVVRFVLFYLCFAFSFFILIFGNICYTHVNKLFVIRAM